MKSENTIANKPTDRLMFWLDIAVSACVVVFAVVSLFDSSLDMRLSFLILINVSIAIRLTTATLKISALQEQISEFIGGSSSVDGVPGRRQHTREASPHLFKEQR